MIQEAREELRRLIREFKAQGPKRRSWSRPGIREKESNLRQSFSKEEEGSETENRPGFCISGLESDRDPSLSSEAARPFRGKKPARRERRKTPFPVRCSMKSRRPPANSKSSGFGSKKRFPWWTKPSMKLSWEGCGNCKSFMGPGPAGFARPCGIICGNTISWRHFGPGGPGPGRRRRHGRGGRTVGRAGAPKDDTAVANEGRDSRRKNRRDQGEGPPRRGRLRSCFPAESGEKLFGSVPVSLGANPFLHGK